MTGKPRTTVVAIAVAALALTGCHVDRSSSAPPAGQSTAVGDPSLRLVAFTSCDDVIAGLNRAAAAVVGPYGLPNQDVSLAGGVVMAERGAPGPMDDSAGVPAAPAVPDYSGTNVQESGVDEPDIVKTDGRRILTITRGELHVIDAATHRQTASLNLVPVRSQNPVFYGTGDILIYGDRALIISNPVTPIYFRKQSNDVLRGPQFTLVDLSGTPSVLATYDIDGGYLDARQVGSVVRLVVRSSPRVSFPYRENTTDKQRVATNKQIIRKLGVDEWLPRFTVTQGGVTSSGHVPCDRVQRPTEFTAANMLTVLSFDLQSGALGNGDPTTIVADGDTVYASGTSLYVASDQRWRAFPIGGPVRPVPNIAVPDDGAGTSSGGGTTDGGGTTGDAGTSDSAGPDSEIRPAPTSISANPIRPKPPTVTPRTEIYRFDTSQPGAPRFTGAGSVPGFLLNSYAMSEWNGNLRVAATTSRPWADFSAATDHSSVYVLSTSTMKTVGHVDGLGAKQRIYAVRYAGPLAYVVTFRQVDPLYVIDLSNPAQPSVRGELELAGYSAYLHPIDDTHLIGIGQDADSHGRVKGTMLSVFDVSDPGHPVRTASTVIPGAMSNAEYDPHAFLYWPATGSVVVPISGPTGTQQAIEFRLTGTSITKVGTITHPGQYAALQRSLVIGSTLWTLSTTGLMASDLGTLHQLAWLPLPQ